MIGPAQVTDPSLAVLPRREADLFIFPINEGQASAVGIGRPPEKCPSQTVCQGAPRGGFRRRPERRADRAGDSLVFQYSTELAAARTSVGGVTDACDAQIGSREIKRRLPQPLAPRSRCFLGSVHLTKSLWPWAMRRILSFTRNSDGAQAPRGGQARGGSGSEGTFPLVAKKH